MLVVGIKAFVITLLPIIAWIISEIVIFKSIKKSKKDDSIWLAINIILPIVGCIIYKLTYKSINE